MKKKEMNISKFSHSHSNRYRQFLKKHFLVKNKKQEKPVLLYILKV